MPSHHKSILLDANMLTLLIVGRVSVDQVEKCRRTRHYKVIDFHLLAEHLDSFNEIITIPNILTETSNLIGVLNGRYLEDARKLLAQAVLAWEEIYIKSSDAVKHVGYAQLGLTDAAILLASTQYTQVITDDFELYRCLADKAVPVTNFNHLRTFNWATN